MTWTAGVKVIMAVILGIPTLGHCTINSCVLRGSCTRVILVDGDYTGPIQPHRNRTCPKYTGSGDDTFCFFSFDTSGPSINFTQNTSTVPPPTTTTTTTTTKKNQLPNDKKDKWEPFSKLPKNIQKYLEKHPDLFKKISVDLTSNTDWLEEYISRLLNSTDATDIYNCAYKDIGMWLLKENGSYQLLLSREQDIRPQKKICFVSDECNQTAAQWISDNFTRCDGPSNHVCQMGGCNVTCLDPHTFCNDAQYKNCDGAPSNDDTITFKGPSCWKCGSPVQKPEAQIDMANMSLPNLKAESTDKSEAMKQITTKVLEIMGNQTTASVTLGDVKGVFVKPKDRTKLEPVSFIYSDVTLDLGIIQDQTQLATYPTAISVPKEAFEKAANQSNGTLFTSVFRFTNFTKDEKNSTVLNNDVYSIDMGAEISNLTTPISITFRNITKRDVTLHCHSWDGNGSRPNWTTDGCSTTEMNSTVMCKCVHLTFFAVLMSPNPTETISSADLSNLTYITSIGCGLSVFFLGVALFMHFLLRRAKTSDSVNILMNLFVALSLLDLTFLTNEYVANTDNIIGCKLMAGFMHYCLLTSFTWFGLEALHLCMQLSRSSTPIEHYITKICIAGWAPPAIVVTAIFCMQKYSQIVIHTDTGKDVKMCWITDPAIHYVVNIGYYSIIFTFTFSTFVIMLRWIFLLKKTKLKNSKPAAGSGKKGTATGTSDALTVMGLSCILGLTWGFAFFAYGALRLPSYYIFTILNSFQGFFLFIYYYKTSKLVGENMASESTTATEATSMENPYDNTKPL